jgi:undecaprenyl-diphosphatase
MLAFLQEFDLALFKAINGWHSLWADELMYWVSNKYVWIPAYALLLFFIYRKFGPRKTLYVLLSVGVLILLSDRTTSGLLKPWIERFRPCRPEAGLGDWVHLVNNKCGGKYGFVSSHAANFFAMATFFSLLFKQKRLTLLFMGIALLTAYSRVYLGVHYPGDVIAGALVGVGFGLLIWWGGERVSERVGAGNST